LTKYDPAALAEAEIDRFLQVVADRKQDKKKNAWERLKEFNNDIARDAKQFVDNGDLDGLRKLLSEKSQGKAINFIENPCSPLPYTTRFYNANLQGIFCLNYSRLGHYWNLGDRIELEEAMARRLLKEGKIEDVTTEQPFKTLSDDGRIGKIYRITEKTSPNRKERASALFNALAILRGGAKQAQFGTDVSPKVLILAGLSCGNPIFNHLFKDDPEGPIFKIETFKEIIKDYADRILTPVLIGIRSGYLKNENEVRDLAGTYTIQQDKGIRTITKENPSEGRNALKVGVEVMTPVEAARRIGESLK